MFSAQHIAWLAICAVLAAGSLRALEALRPSLQRVLGVACVICALSELVKVMTYVQMVPASDGSAVNVFIEWRHLPLHLCSVQIFLILYARLSESERRREVVLAFMYPTCIGGAAAALLLPSIFTNGITPAQAFASPIAYQFFVYHTMLVVLGVWTVRSGEVRIRFAHLWSTLAMLFCLGLASIYLNAAFAAVTYRGTELLTVESTPNFFFTYRTPVGIALTEPWQWYAYIALFSLAVALVMVAFYLPFLVRERRAA